MIELRQEFQDKMPGQDGEAKGIPDEFLEQVTELRWPAQPLHQFIHRDTLI